MHKFINPDALQQQYAALTDMVFLPAWKDGYRKSHLVPDLYQHDECGLAFKHGGPCPNCFNTVCTRCEAPHWDLAIVTGNPEDANVVCDECWEDLTA